MLQTSFHKGFSSGVFWKKPMLHINIIVVCGYFGTYVLTRDVWRCGHDLKTIWSSPRNYQRWQITWNVWKKVNQTPKPLLITSRSFHFSFWFWMMTTEKRWRHVPLMMLDNVWWEPGSRTSVPSYPQANTNNKSTLRVMKLSYLMHPIPRNCVDYMI